ncbi:right-handed parallel beta-helix repeat-containing protein [Tranquillimonas alkanivorans]|nr:right-handed parallel beta-helix repeat-containing protein [Tranquillimonas alkanivorans]
MAVLLTALGIQRCAAADGSVLHVSPLGNDQWSGRFPAPLKDGTDGPMASFEAARDAARAIGEAVRIIVHGGDYFLRSAVEFDERDSGLSLIAAEDELPVLHGGMEVADWVEDRDGRWSARVDLPEGAGIGGLFVDGRRQIKARFPNAPEDGDLRGGWLFARTPAPGDESLGNTRFGARPGDLPVLDDVSGVVAHVTGGLFPNTQWGSDTLPVLSIDAAKDLVHVAGTGYFFTGAGSRYYLAGAESFLDAPGEWWFDDGNARLHYIPGSGVDPSDARMTVAILPTFFRFAGTEDISVEGLSFRNGAPEGSGKYATDMRSFGAIRIIGGDRMRVHRNYFENVGVAIHVAESDDVTISGNDIAHVAGNAIFFGPQYGTFGRSDNGAIIGNRIRDVGEVYFESAGIWFQASRNLRIAFNFVERAAQFGISGGSLWGDQDASHRAVIEYNLVLRTNQATADGGAIKMMGAQSTPLDSSIRYNVVTGTDQLMARPDGSFWPPRYEKLNEWPSPISWAIYMDGRASGVSVVGNLLARNVTGIGINGGWNNEVRRNVVLSGTGCAFRVDDLTGRGWRPDWARPNSIERNFAQVSNGGCAANINAPDHGTEYVEISDNFFWSSGPPEPTPRE